MATSACDVRAITGSVLTDAALQPFIVAAGCVLENVSGCLDSKGIDGVCRDLAGAWLAAHMLTMTSVGKDSATVAKERFENYSVERVVGGFTGKGVLQTPYGQTANTLTGGCLQEADKAPMQVCFFG